MATTTNGPSGPKLYEAIIENVDGLTKNGEIDKLPKEAKRYVQTMSEEFESVVQNVFCGALKTTDSGDVEEEDVKEVLTRSWDKPGVYKNTVGLQQEQVQDWIVEALEEADNDCKCKTTVFAQVLKQSFEEFDNERWFVVAGYGLGFDMSMIGNTDFFLDLVFHSNGLRILIWKNANQ